MDDSFAQFFKFWNIEEKADKFYSLRHLNNNPNFNVSISSSFPRISSINN